MANVNQATGPWLVGGEVLETEIIGRRKIFWPIKGQWARQTFRGWGRKGGGLSAASNGRNDRFPWLPQDHATLPVYVTAMELYLNRPAWFGGENFGVLKLDAMFVVWFLFRHRRLFGLLKPNVPVCSVIGHTIPTYSCPHIFSEFFLGNFYPSRSDDHFVSKCREPNTQWPDVMY
jgi:hypothetical protein